MQENVNVFCKRKEVNLKGIIMKMMILFKDII